DEFPHALGRYAISVGWPAGRDAPWFPPTSLSRMSGQIFETAQDVAGHLNDGVFDVLGLSLGGLVAQRIALDYRGNVRRMVLAATLPASPQSLLLPFRPNIDAKRVLNSSERPPEIAAMLYEGDFRAYPE